MRKKIICILATTVIISTTSAFGAVKEGSFSLSPLVGGYVYGDNQQFNASPVVGVRAGYSLTRAIGVEALYDYVTPTDSKYWAIKDISMQRFGAQGLYHFLPDNQLVPYLAAGVSGVKFSGSGVNPETHLSFDYGAGAKYFVTEDIAVRVDLRHILYGYNNTSYGNVEFMLGATFQFGGITPAVKPLVTAAALKSEPVITDAVPESSKATLATALPESVACAPVPAAVICPPPTETIKTVIAPVTKEACEPFLVAAAAKAAPAAPVAQTCSVPADSIVLFSYEKADVKQKYYEELDKIGTFLKSYPGSKVTIEGHTSGMGDKDANLKLSQARADNAKSHIMYKFGIDGSRITAKGYGLTRPVASNKTTSGRMQNRRIVAVFSCE
jgi:OOP family OmpA-OmpF porin